MLSGGAGVGDANTTNKFKRSRNSNSVLSDSIQASHNRTVYHHPMTMLKFEADYRHRDAHMLRTDSR